MRHGVAEDNQLRRTMPSNSSWRRSRSAL